MNFREMDIKHSYISKGDNWTVIYQLILMKKRLLESTKKLKKLNSK